MIYIHLQTIFVFDFILKGVIQIKYRNLIMNNYQQQYKVIFWLNSMTMIHIYIIIGVDTYQINIQQYDTLFSMKF